MERWSLLEGEDLAAALQQYPAAAGACTVASLRGRLVVNVFEPHACPPLCPLDLTVSGLIWALCAAAEEVTARIAQLRAARCLLNIQKAMAALHTDEDFQADIAQVVGLSAV